MREVYCPINLSQQVVFRYQHVRAQQFDRLALFGLSVHHFHHLRLLYQKRPLMATFFDRLRRLTHTGQPPLFWAESQNKFLKDIRHSHTLFVIATLYKNGGNCRQYAPCDKSTFTKSYVLKILPMDGFIVFHIIIPHLIPFV